MSKQEESELNHLISIYKKSNRNFELAIRRYVMQIDLESSVLNGFLFYIDEIEALEEVAE